MLTPGKLDKTVFTGRNAFAQMAKAINEADVRYAAKLRGEDEFVPSDSVKAEVRSFHRPLI